MHWRLHHECSRRAIHGWGPTDSWWPAHLRAAHHVGPCPRRRVHHAPWQRRHHVWRRDTGAAKLLLHHHVRRRGAHHGRWLLLWRRRGHAGAVLLWGVGTLVEVRGRWRRAARRSSAVRWHPAWPSQLLLLLLRGRPCRLHWAVSVHTIRQLLPLRQRRRLL